MYSNGEPHDENFGHAESERSQRTNARLRRSRPRPFRRLADRKMPALPSKRALAPAVDLTALGPDRLAEVCRTWLHCNPDIVMLLAPGGRIAHVSRHTASLLDAHFPAEVIGAPWGAIWPKSERTRAHAAASRAKAGETARFQGQFETISGNRQWWDVIVAAVANTDLGQGPELLVLLRDVTAFKLAEEQQAQSRRLEAVGRLAAGIAHDFNNLLTVIMSAADSLAIDATTESARDLALVSLAAAERGADLVRRLLTFSNRPRLAGHSIDAPDTLGAVSKLLQRTLPGDIRLEVALPEGAVYCQGDRAELESALLNICINARDAMPAGGRLRLSLGAIDADAALTLGLKAGGYAAFSITDTGVGMSKATLDRAIEPFFTTKAASGGTGLGLSGAHGFAQGYGGALTIESREGRGSTVSLYLPLASGLTQRELDLQAPPSSAEGCDVLVVEDNAQVRAQTTRLLADLGCRVTPVADAAAALEHLAADRPVDLLITDLQLTRGLNGRELAAAAQAGRPELKVLFMSGALEEFGTRAGDAQAEFLSKPFGRPQLAAAVASALARYPAPSATASPKLSGKKTSASRTKEHARHG
jgi:signal transduction histidine kinase/FixJ family two-component response regulator